MNLQVAGYRRIDSFEFLLPGIGFLSFQRGFLVQRLLQPQYRKCSITLTLLLVSSRQNPFEVSLHTYINIYMHTIIRPQNRIRHSKAPLSPGYRSKSTCLGLRQQAPVPSILHLRFSALQPLPRTRSPGSNPFALFVLGSPY